MWRSKLFHGGWGWQVQMLMLYFGFGHPPHAIWPSILMNGHDTY